MLQRAGEGGQESSSTHESLSHSLETKEQVRSKKTISKAVSFHMFLKAESLNKERIHFVEQQNAYSYENRLVLSTARGWYWKVSYANRLSTSRYLLPSSNKRQADKWREAWVDIQIKSDMARLQSNSWDPVLEANMSGQFDLVS